jgi:putative addiction module antidote
MVALKLRKIGNSVGAVIPQDVLSRMHLREGDTVFLTESPGGYRITPYDPDFEKQMTEARRIMNQRRHVLRELAK